MTNNNWCTCEFENGAVITLDSSKNHEKCGKPLNYGMANKYEYLNNNWEKELNINDLYLPDEDERNSKKITPEEVFGNPDGDIIERFEYKLPFTFGRIKQDLGEKNFVRFVECIKIECSNLLTKKDQEHKAELEMIKGEIDKVFPINTESNMVEVDMYSYDLAKKDAISTLDSHINKL